MTNTKALERISVDFNGNKTASVISDVPEILGTLEYIRADLAPQWQDIATAPKDGTSIFIYRKDWDCAPVAQWMDYPSNPVLDASGDYSWMQGWGHDTMFFCVGEEDYWLGWDGDPMPTHWMPLPTSPEPAP